MTAPHDMKKATQAHRDAGLHGVPQVPGGGGGVARRGAAARDARRERRRRQPAGARASASRSCSASLCRLLRRTSRPCAHPLTPVLALPSVELKRKIPTQTHQSRCNTGREPATHEVAVTM